MKVREILAKTILTKTAISSFDYCINPYVGCGHGCRYCYASFMKRFTGHLEPWGEFIDVKVN
ncbi:MAG: radical SAM protein, partial [Thermodesulfobacteriota bacterium]